MYGLNSHLSLQLILRTFWAWIKRGIRRISVWNLILIKLVVKKCLSCCIWIYRLICISRHSWIILIIFSLQIIVILVLLIVILVVTLHLICDLLPWIEVGVLELVAVLYSDMVLVTLLKIRLESNSWVE